MQIKTFLKALISIVLLWIAVRQVNLAELGRVLHGLNYYWLLAAIMLQLFVLLTLSYRLSWLLYRQAVKIKKIIPLIEICWISQFFNLFLPGQMAGDLVKIYKIAGKEGPPVQSTMVVVMDRVLGLTTMVLIAVLALLIGRYSLNLSVARHVVILLAFGCGLFYYFIFSKKIFNRIKILKSWLKIIKIDKIAAEMYQGFHSYRNQPRVLFYAIIISIIGQLLTFIVGYFVAESVGVSVPIGYYFVILPVISVICVLPLSISGLGLQDGAIVFFFSQLGVDPARALGFSLLSHIIRWGMGLAGGLVYLFEREE